MAEDEKTEDEKVEESTDDAEKTEESTDSAENESTSKNVEEENQEDKQEDKDSTEVKDKDDSDKKENLEPNDENNDTANNEKWSVYDIVGDESLPEIGGDLQENKLNSKLKQLQRKRKNSGKKKKHKVSTILIIGTIVIGLITMYFTTRDKEVKTNNNIVVELPTFAVNVYSESEKNSYNIKVNVALSVDSKAVKDYNEEEAYNIIYETISNMDYDVIAGENGEEMLKEQIQYAIKEQTKGHLDSKVYVAGTDPQKANLNGRTIDTKADGESKKATNISNKTTGQ